MTRVRALLVAATIAGPITLSLAALSLDRLLWPFSNYPMYSERYGPTTAVTRAVGVTGDDQELQLPVQIEPTGLPLHIMVNKAMRLPDAPARLTRIVTAIGAEYGRLRTAGRIAGPPLVAIRIYRDTINLATQPHVRSAVLVTQAPAP